MSDQTFATIQLVFEVVVTLGVLIFIPSYFSFKGKVEHFLGDDWHQFLKRIDRIEEKLDKLS